MGMNQETTLSENTFLVSQTDAKGKILFANEEFCRVAEYKLEDLIGKPHNLVRHKDMPKAVFKDLWETIQRGKVWQGYVKNSTKSGGYYWVYATIYPYKNKQGEQCYLSCRRMAPRDMIEKYSNLYKTMH